MKTWRKTISGIDLEFEQIPDGIMVQLENHKFFLKQYENEGKINWKIIEKLPFWLINLEEDLNQSIKEFLMVTFYNQNNAGITK
jgi:hypothetical protein